MYKTTKALGYSINSGIENIFIEISRDNKIMFATKLVKIF